MSQDTHIFISDPLYNFRLYDKRWQKNYNSTFEIDHIYVPQIIKKYKDFGIKTDTTKSLLNLNRKGIIQSCFNMKVNGKVNFQILWNFLKVNYGSLYAYLGLIIIIVPSSLLKKIKRYQFVKKYKVRL